MKLSFPVELPGQQGFRPAQIAATHAVSAHFFNSKLPAIVTMPTGSGKTTVLTAVPFILFSSRVLVLTPSRLVREQIAENFKVLLDLKKITAVPLDLPTPKVFATEGIIGSEQAWEDLRQYDVVVATVPSVSPRDGAIPEPPKDLFDLVLVDEAHHAPARTWARLLDLLKGARQVLFTATPFRRDEKEIQGRIVFTYDLKRAYQDRVFGDITFEPVDATGAPSIDIAIARATEARFNADRAKGLRHLVMVRSDTVSRAKDLEKTYADNTKLRMAFVSGQHSLGHVKRVIAKLTKDELNGIVCVNMFGEGFNLPNLKIAAVHSPHKSLAVTLQFIGRFARTGARDIGGATFLAEPHDSNLEISELYESGAVWRDIIQNLSGARIESEMHTREILDSFAIEAAPDMDDFSLYTVRPYFHAKVFSTPNGADLTAAPNFPDGLQVIFKGLSDPHGAAVYVTREAVRSRWSSDERFTNVEYDLFIFHHNKAAGLLFVCASRRQAKLYTRLAWDILGGRPRSLAQSRINRALNDLKGAEFFNVGMRKRHKFGRIESYRMIAGPSADRAIQESDGRLFDRGHCFGKGVDDGEEVTLGISTSSKVWSNAYDQIPELLDWCDRLAARISSGRDPVTGSGLDHLSAGEVLQQLPADIIAVNWAFETYREPPLAFYHRHDGAFAEDNLLDFDFTIEDSREGWTKFVLSNGDIRWRGIFALDQAEFIQPATDAEPDLVVHVADEDVPVADYLNEQMPTFFCADLSSIEGDNLFRSRLDVEPFGDDDFTTVDWAAEGVDIQKEKPDGGPPRSIFEWLQNCLVQSAAAVVFCDDGSGEVADFITIEERQHVCHVAFYHCKASERPHPGNRVDDLYDVCGQAVKSGSWLQPDRLLARLIHRATLGGVRGYIKGNEADARRLLAAAEFRRGVQFQINIVQPGVKRDGRQPDLSSLLAAARHYLVQGAVDKFGVIGS